MSPEPELFCSCSCLCVGKLLGVALGMSWGSILSKLIFGRNFLGSLLSKYLRGCIVTIANYLASKVFVGGTILFWATFLSKTGYLLSPCNAQKSSYMNQSSQLFWPLFNLEYDNKIYKIKKYKVISWRRKLIVLELLCLLLLSGR